MVGRCGREAAGPCGADGWRGSRVAPCRRPCRPAHAGADGGHGPRGIPPRALPSGHSPALASRAPCACRRCGGGATIAHVLPEPAVHGPSSLLRRFAAALLVAPCLPTLPRRPALPLFGAALSASTTRPLRSATRESRQANACDSRFVDSEPCCQTDSHEARACDAHFPRVALARCRGEGSAARHVACRDVARRQVSRAPRSARRAAARRRCRRRAGGSAGCPRPARRHARPSR